MKIGYGVGGYSFELEANDVTYRLGAKNIIQAKEYYLKHIEELIDDVIDDSFWTLRQLEK